LEAEEYCMTKQVLAIKINGVMSVSNLKENYDFSDEKMSEILKLAKAYEPYKNGNRNTGCEYKP